MKITKIEEQKKNKNRCSIYIDGEYHSSVDEDILEEMGFCEGMELNPDEFSEKLEAVQYKSAMKAALYMLTHSSKTENEIKEKLKEKNHTEKAIGQVLEYLKETGYVNDEDYAESFIRSMRNMTGTSRRTLSYKLASKGVDSEIIQHKLEEAEINDYASALKVARKKLAGMKGEKKEKASKLFGFLYRKGFGMEVCRQVIETLELEEN